MWCHPRGLGSLAELEEQEACRENGNNGETDSDWKIERFRRGDVSDHLVSVEDRLKLTIKT